MMDDNDDPAKVKLCEGCEILYPDSIEYSKEQVFNFLLEHSVIINFLICPLCGWEIRINATRANFRCRKVGRRKHRKRAYCTFYKTVWSQTFFHCDPDCKVRASPSKIFRLVSAVMWLPPRRDKVIHKEFSPESPLIKDWFLPVREVLIDAVSENSNKLGGKDQIVELAEATWQTKNNKEGLWNWAFGGIDRQSGETFLVPVEYHNLKSLRDIISEKINPGTVIVTNCTKDFTSEEIEELKNNLGVSFVQPAFSTIYEVIKHHWREVNKDFESLSRYSIGRLAEYLFKSKHPVQAKRLHAFFVAAGRLYPADSV